MKYILSIVLFLGIAFSGKSQNYADSSITLQLPQRFSFYIGKYVEKSLFTVATRNLPDIIKPYFGKNLKPDSLFTVPIKAGWIQGALEIMIGTDLGGVVDDYNVTLNNFPAVPNYTSLATQVATKAAGNTSEKLVAKWLYDWFVARKAEKKKPIEEEKINMVNW